MLTHPTHDRLITLGLAGVAKALEQQQRQPDIEALSFEERLALLAGVAIEREHKRLGNRLMFAGLRQTAIVEDTDMKAARGLDKALFARLVAGDWISRHQNLAIIGKTGSARVGSPACSATRRAKMTARWSIIACHACSMRSHSHAATVAKREC